MSATPREILEVPAYRLANAALARSWQRFVILPGRIKRPQYIQDIALEEGISGPEIDLSMNFGCEIKIDQY